MAEPSKITPTVGRIVHVYGFGALPAEPLPGIIVRCWPGAPLANVNVLWDPLNVFPVPDGYDPSERIMATLYSVEVCDPLTPEERAARRAAQPGQAWAEWMPYQQGQAARSDQLVLELTARIAALEQCMQAQVTK